MYLPTTPTHPRQKKDIRVCSSISVLSRKKSHTDNTTNPVLLLIFDTQDHVALCCSDISECTRYVSIVSCLVYSATTHTCVTNKRCLDDSVRQPTRVFR